MIWVQFISFEELTAVQQIQNRLRIAHSRLCGGLHVCCIYKKSSLDVQVPTLEELVYHKSPSLSRRLLASVALGNLMSDQLFILSFTEGSAATSSRGAVRLSSLCLRIPLRV